MPFLRGTSGGVLKCQLFFQAITRRCTMLNLSIHRINVLLSVHSHWLCVMLDVIVILSHAKSIKWRTLGLVPLQRRTFITTFYNPSHKSWNTCVIFPLPNVDLGLQSFQCSKIRSEQHWGRRGAHLSESKDVKSECKKFGKNSRQMAPVSTICDEYCSLIRFYVCKNSFHHLGNRFPFSKWSFLRHHY